MSYAIGEVIFGLNLNDDEFSEISNVISALEEMDMVSSAYSGNGEPPRWLGLQLSQVDECNNVRLDADFLAEIAVTPEREAEYQAKLDELLQDIEDNREEVLGDDITETQLDEAIKYLKTAKPAVWIVWGSS